MVAKTELAFPAFSSRFCLFCDRSIKAWNNHNSLLRITTNEIALFCVDNKLRQMTFFHVYQTGQRPAFEFR